MQRRHFLQLAATGALAAATTGFGAVRPPDLHRLAHPALLALLGDPVAVRRLGRAYHAQVPAEAEANVLVELLAPHATCLDARIRADFAADHTVCLHGWVLARTEARQCALYALLA